MTSLRLNARAIALADMAIERADELRAAVLTLDNGTRVVDFGVNVPGGLQAGVALAKICMGGLGDVALAPLALNDIAYTGVHVWTDHPAVACLASQYAGWGITPEGYFAMGSGPLRAKAGVERELLARVRYREETDAGVLVLETRTLPDVPVAEWIAGRAGIAPDRLTLMAAPTASLAGSVQISARTIETGLHKMDTLGFDVTKIVAAVATAPLAPVAATDVRAIGRTNDCVLYGGQARYTAHGQDDELAALVDKLPSSASKDYGTPFAEIFARYDRDFYKIDPLLFSPAEVWITSVETGRTFHAGRVNPDVLRTSLFG